MIIGIDARALVDIPLSGVGEYTKQLLEILPVLNSNITFRFFLNQSPHIPNKILNSFFAFKGIQIERFLGDVDRVFLPNHIFFSTKKPYTITVHDLSFHIFPEFYNIKTRMWHKVVGSRLLYENATNIIAVSESTKNDLIREFHIPAEKIHVVYSGIGQEFFSFAPSEEKKEFFRKKYALPKHFILSLGTQEKRKNILGIIRAFEIFKEGREAEDMFLLLAGKPGFQFHEIEKYAKKSKFAPFIRFLGYISEEAKPYLYQLARVFVYPSFYEGFGFPPLEAMAVGTPVVISNTPALLETTRGAALSVSPKEPEEIATAISLLLHDFHLRDIMIQKGKEVASHYTWEECGRKTLEIITR